MTVRALTPDGDIVTSGQHFIKEEFDIGQTVQTRLLLFLGEYFRDITDGTDWFGQVLTKQGTIDQSDALVQQRIIETDGVIRLLAFSTDFNIAARRYAVTAEVLTDFGTITVQTEGLPNG